MYGYIQDASNRPELLLAATLISGILRMDLYISAGGQTKIQGQLGLPLQGTRGISFHIQLCSLLGPEPSVSSWLEWAWDGMSGCTGVLKTGFLHVWCIMGGGGHAAAGDTSGGMGW